MSSPTTKKPVERKITLTSLIRSVDPEFFKRNKKVSYRFSGGRTFYEKDERG